MTRRTFLLGWVALFPYLYVERLSVAVRRYRVEVRNLPPAFEGFTILHFSDFHEKEYGSREDELISLISRQNFDAVAITGDFVRGNTPSLAPALGLISEIRKIADRPLYAVLGNHDWRLERGDEFEGILREAGVRVLSNRWETLERGQDRLSVIGVNDPVTGRARLEHALKGCDPRAPKLLLSHSPHPFLAAAARGVDVMLAGHTHGGQVRVPILGASFVPAMGFFPRFDYGLYRLGSSSLIVSGGLGESGISVRFNIRPEIALITFAGTPEPRPASAGVSG